MTSRTFDLGFDQGLEYFIGGWTFVIKDYNNEILKINNHVHLNTFKKLVRDLYGMFICKKWTIWPYIHKKKTRKHYFKWNMLLNVCKIYKNYMNWKILNIDLFNCRILHNTIVLNAKWQWWCMYIFGNFKLVVCSCYWWPGMVWFKHITMVLCQYENNIKSWATLEKTQQTQKCSMWIKSLKETESKLQIKPRNKTWWNYILICSIPSCKMQHNWLVEVRSQTCYNMKLKLQHDTMRRNDKWHNNNLFI
jgi:hypothetical protein